MTGDERRQLLAAIAREIGGLGGRALLVGGCVRDGLLGRESEDIDCEVHGVRPQALLSLLSRFDEVDSGGEAYGVYTLRDAGIDMAIPRLEARTGARHRDFSVTLDPWLPPERAAARRDFTVNAIMRDALTGEYVDPFGGIGDLSRGMLRMVPGGQFEEDPLRVLRGAQFAARFCLEPEEDTLRAMARMPLSSLSADRVMSETKKALMQAERPDVFFRVLKRAGALSPWFGELRALCGVRGNSPSEGDAFEHAMLVLREAASVRERAEEPLFFMLAAMTHDLGRALAEEGRGEGGMALGEALLARLGAGRAAIAYCRDMCRLHGRAHACFCLKEDTACTNLLFDEAVCARDLALLVLCGTRGTGMPRASADEEARFFEDRLACYEDACGRPMPTAEMLRRAGIAPGPGMGGALRQARRDVLMGRTAEEAVKRLTC